MEILGMNVWVIWRILLIIGIIASIWAKKVFTQAREMENDKLDVLTIDELDALAIYSNVMLGFFLIVGSTTIGGFLPRLLLLLGDEDYSNFQEVCILWLIFLFIGSIFLFLSSKRLFKEGSGDPPHISAKSLRELSKRQEKEIKKLKRKIR